MILLIPQVEGSVGEGEDVIELILGIVSFVHFIRFKWGIIIGTKTGMDDRCYDGTSFHSLLWLLSDPVPLQLREFCFPHLCCIIRRQPCYINSLTVTSATTIEISARGDRIVRLRPSSIADAMSIGPQPEPELEDPSPLGFFGDVSRKTWKRTKQV